MAMLMLMTTAEAAKPEGSATAPETAYRQVGNSLINSATMLSFTCTIDVFGKVRINITGPPDGFGGSVVSSTRDVPAIWVGTADEYCDAWADYWISGEVVPPY